MTKWTIVNNGDGKILVVKDGHGFEVDSNELPDTVHAVQWDGEAGEVEYKDVSTGDATYNLDIDSFGEYTFAEAAWETAYATALNASKQLAYDIAYDAAIADGKSEPDAVAAGNAARDAITSL